MCTEYFYMTKPIFVSMLFALVQFKQNKETLKINYYYTCLILLISSANLDGNVNVIQMI